MHKNLTAQTTGRLNAAIALSIAVGLTIWRTPDNPGIGQILSTSLSSALYVALGILMIYSTVVMVGLLLNVATRSPKLFRQHVQVVPEVRFEPAGFPTVVKAMAAETLAIIKAFWYLFPWKNETGTVAGKANPLTRPVNDTPVLLVHGFMCNAGVWTRIRPHLHHRGITSHTICCDPLGGDIDDFAHEVARGIEELKRQTGASQVRLMGHSMGGLIIRAYVRRFGHESVESAMCLGAPHQGTVYALGGQGTCARQMLPGNRWLQTLSQSPEDLGFRPKMTNIFSTLENIVQPAASGALPGSRNWRVNHCGHTIMPADRGVLQLVDAWLDEKAQEMPARRAA